MIIKECIIKSIQSFTSPYMITDSLIVFKSLDDGEEILIIIKTWDGKGIPEIKAVKGTDEIFEIETEVLNRFFWKPTMNVWCLAHNTIRKIVSVLLSDEEMQKLFSTIEYSRENIGEYICNDF